MQCVMIVFTLPANSSQIHSLSLPTQICIIFFFFLKYQSSLICAAHIFWDIWPSTGAWPTYQELHFKGHWLSLSQQLTVTNRSSARVRLCVHPLSPCWYWSGLSLNRSVQVVITTVNVQLPCCIQKTLFPYIWSPPLAFTVFLSPHPQCALSPREYRFPFRVEHSIVSNSLYLDQLWVSTLTATYFR